MATLTQQDLESRLWRAANALRDPVDPDDFKTYAFPMLFWKWISDTRGYERAQAVDEFGEDVEAEVEADYHNIGALTQIIEKYAPDKMLVIISDRVRDIDGIVTQVRFTGWKVDDSGDSGVRRSIRKVLKTYRLPVTGDLLDKTNAYVTENY